jgi:hypothetical protein
MPNQKISQLTGATTPLAGTETLPVVQSSVTKQVSVANLTAGRSVGMAGLNSTADAVISNGTNGVNIGASEGSIELYRSDSVAYIDFKTNTSEDADCRIQQVSNGLNISTGGQGSMAGTIDLASNGDVKVSRGNLVISTSGKGIDFSATAGTGTSELFADYEEGTFTPVVTAAAGSITSYNASGTYVKIGKTVVFQMTFNITNPGTASGLVNFSGLPFTSQNVTDYVYEGRTRENNVSGASSDFLIVANNTTGIILTSTWASNQSYSLAGTYITA